nr:MAG TPA: hypothetical protein [Caudoviricetes sp.]
MGCLLRLYDGCVVQSCLKAEKAIDRRCYFRRYLE